MVVVREVVDLGREGGRKEGIFFQNVQYLRFRVYAPFC